jgi:hypothetical protein
MESWFQFYDSHEHESRLACFIEKDTRFPESYILFYRNILFIHFIASV